MKKKTQFLGCFLIFLAGIAIGIFGTCIYNSKKDLKEASTQESKQPEQESEQPEQESKQPEQDDKKGDELTDYESQASFILTKDCHPSVPKDMAVYYTKPVEYDDYVKMMNMFYLEGTENINDIKKIDSNTYDENCSQYPIDTWKSDLIEDERTITIDSSRDYFNYKCESKISGYLDSASGKISMSSENINSEEVESDKLPIDYYSEKGKNVLDNKFDLSKHIEGEIAFDEKHQEEYAVRTYIRKEKKLPVLGAYYYKDSDDANVYGETLALHLNSRGVIAMILSHVRNMTDKKESIDDSELISVETASDAVLEYLKADKDIIRRISTSDAYAVWYPVKEKEDILYKPAWYFKTKGTCYYKEEGDDEKVSSDADISFCVDMCSGQVFELYDADY